MRDLGSLRANWEQAEEINLRLLQGMTPQESLQHWLQLQQAFEWQLKQTEELFAHQRRDALAELQSRLKRLADQPT